MSELYWQNKYKHLVTEIQAIHEKAEWKEEEQPDECISKSEEFFMSFDMQIVDNEEYAKKHWDGKYFRMVKA